MLEKAFKTNDWLFGFFFFGAVLFLIYPQIFFMRELIVAPSTWELQDPAVTSLVFMPGMRLLRYEFLQNHNFLWSNLRGMGQPLLANEIQAAPLFPLTLMLMGISDPYFWNVLVLLRLLLLGVFSFMVARQLFKLERAGSIIFSLCFAYAVHVLRWNNHSWQNGLLAGVFYLLTAFRLFELETFSTKKTILTRFLFLSLAVYSMMTSGFPESAFLSAVMVTILMTPSLVQKLLRKQIAFYTVTLFFISHLIGFGLSSPQWLSMLDFMGEGAGNFRSGPGLSQFVNFSVLLRLVARVSDTLPPGHLVHFFNLGPVFLFFLGVIASFKKKLTLNQIAALACAALFLLKNFPVWPALNDFVGHLPFAKGIWFIIYFFPLFLISFSLLAGLGMDFLLSYSRKESNFLKNHFSLWFSLLLTLIVFIDCMTKASQLNWTRVLVSLFSFASVLILIWIFHFKKSLRQKELFGLAVIFLIVLDLVYTVPKQFTAIDTDSYRYDIGSSESAKQLASVLKNSNLSLSEMRDLTPGGAHLEYGIGTSHNGTPPIVPQRQSLFLTHLYQPEPGWGAQMPVADQLIPFGWQLRGANLYIAAETPKKTDVKDTRTFENLGPFGKKNLYYDKTALPRAYVAQACHSAESIEEALKILKTSPHFSLGQTTLEGLKPIEKEFCKSYRNDFKKISIKDKGSEVFLSTVKGPAVVVLNDNYYQDWRAIDSLTREEFKIFPSNVTFRAVILPESRSYEIEFRYVPHWTALCRRLMGTSILLLLATLLACTLRKPYSKKQLATP